MKCAKDDSTPGCGDQNKSTEQRSSVETGARSLPRRGHCRGESSPPRQPWSALWRMRAGTAALLLLCVTLPASALAQSSPSDPDFQRGLEALEQGDAGTAVDAFTRSLAAHETSAGWFNLGIAQNRLGDTQAAWLAFDAYLSAADPTTDGERMRIAQAEVERLQSANTVLIIDVTPPPAELLVDGRPTWTKNGILLLTPGQHRIDVRREGFAALRQALDLPAGRFRLTAELLDRTRDAPRVRTVPDTFDADVPIATPPAGLTLPSQPLPPQGPAGSAPHRVDETTSPFEQKSKSRKDPCLLAGLCTEASIILGVPNALGIGLAVRVHPLASITLSAHLLPAITIDGTKVRAQLWTVGGRYHPFEDGLFLSAGFALQRMFAERDHALATAKAQLNLPMFALGVGYMAESGFSFGIDANLFIELRNSPLKVSQVNSPDEEALQSELQEQTTAAIDELRHLLPVAFQLNLLRVGYVF